MLNLTSQHAALVASALKCHTAVHTVRRPTIHQSPPTTRPPIDLLVTDIIATKQPTLPEGETATQTVFLNRGQRLQSVTGTCIQPLHSASTISWVKADISLLVHSVISSKMV